jgi:phosphoserine phosphatase RsbU/P
VTTIAREDSYTAARILVDHLYAQSFPPIPGIDIGTAYVLAEDNLRVGGDLIDIYKFNNGSVAISVADISGKGAKAAARAALVKYGLRAYVSSGLTPAQVLRNLNLLYIETSTFEASDEDSFVSVFLGIIDPELRIMTYASAGHDPVMLMNPGRPLETLPPTAPVVGIFEESQKLFHQRLVTLEPGGATLVVTTDGVTEARAEDGSFFSHEQLTSFLESHRGRPAQEQADALLRATRDYCDGRPQDDIAIVVARFP